jgi:hypothetical protein
MSALFLAVWLAVAQIGVSHTMPAKRVTQFYIVGASEYGGPSDPSTKGDMGSCGKHLTGKHAIAELYMGSALGHLPCGTKLIIQAVGGSGATVEAEKLDIGAGGAPVQGHARRVDLWWETARAMGFKGTGLIRIRRADGKPIIGPNDKETATGAEGTGFFGIGVGPNVAPNASDQAEQAIKSIGSWTTDLGKILGFIGSSSGWARILKVVGGSVLLVVAIDELSKIGPGPATNVKGTVGGTAAKAAKKATEVALL